MLKVAIDLLQFCIDFLEVFIESLGLLFIEFFALDEHYSLYVL